MANKTEEIVEPLVLEVLTEEYELVDTEYVKEGADWYLRILVDKKSKDEKICLEDCSKISRLISEMLDIKDPIIENYFLEVSSPGIDRALRKERDFVRESGKDVEIKLYKPMNGQKEFEGTLIGLTQDDIVQIEFNNRIIEINRKDIAIIRLKVIF
ncbi:MAG: ribosome maturation factor RimP [Proteocatella sp.]